MTIKNESEVFKEQKIRFAMRRVKAIRDRVSRMYSIQGHYIDFQDNQLALRIYAVMWLNAAEQGDEKSADNWIQMSTIFSAECILAGVAKQVQ